MTPNRYERCKDFLYRRRLHLTGYLPGSDEWDALPDDDPAKTAALAAVGLRAVLDQDLADLRTARALKDATVDLAQSRDWSAVGRSAQRHQEWLRANPWARRVSA